MGFNVIYWCYSWYRLLPTSSGTNMGPIFKKGMYSSYSHVSEVLLINTHQNGRFCMLACSQNWSTLLTHNCSCHSHIIITFYQPCWNWWHLFFLSNEVDWNYLSCTFNMNRDFVDLQKCVFRFIIIICVSDCTIQTGSKKKIIIICVLPLSTMHMVGTSVH